MKDYLAAWLTFVFGNAFGVTIGLCYDSAFLISLVVLVDVALVSAECWERAHDGT